MSIEDEAKLASAVRSRDGRDGEAAGSDAATELVGADWISIFHAALPAPEGSVCETPLAESIMRHLHAIFMYNPAGRPTTSELALRFPPPGSRAGP